MSSDGTLDENERREVHPEEYEDQVSDASENDLNTWAEQYDELNGAPENEEDR